MTGPRNEASSSGSIVDGMGPISLSTFRTISLAGTPSVFRRLRASSAIPSDSNTPTTILAAICPSWSIESLTLPERSNGDKAQRGVRRRWRGLEPLVGEPLPARRTAGMIRWSAARRPAIDRHARRRKMRGYGTADLAHSWRQYAVAHPAAGEDHRRNRGRRRRLSADQGPARRAQPADTI